MLNFLLLALMPGAFALNPIVGRALTGIYEPGQLTVVRWLAAAVLVGLIAVATKTEHWSLRRGGWWRILALGALGMGLCSYCAYAAVQTTIATNVTLIYSSTAALVVLYEISTRQIRPNPILIGGVVLCMAGTAVVVSGGDLGRFTATGPTIGDLWAVAGTAGWTIYTIAMKRERSGLSPLVLFTVMSFAGAVAFVPVAGFETARTGAPGLDLAAIAWIAALVLIASVGSYLSYNLAIRRTGPILTSATLTLSPLYTAVLAMMLIGEQLAWYHAVGGALVILGLATINISRTRTR